jgi:poly(beta-D-mannuronate) lyase
MRIVLGAFLTGAMLLVSASSEAAERTLVRTQHEFRKAVDAADPGDTIVLANGEWRDFQIMLRGRGKAGAPITLAAEEKGRVLVTGRSHLRLAGEHLVVSGLVFVNGWAPSGEVIAFRGKAGEPANHSRVTEVVIERFNNPVRTESDHWVALYGSRNRFDHSQITGKGNQGATLVVVRDKAHGLENHHRIDHNYFGPRPPLGANGGETIRIGTSHESLSDSHTILEDNYFDRCDGEVEIVSVKSGANVIRRNVFFQSQGALTLRHGNGNLVEENVFLGGGKANTGGVRVINRDQVVRHNYMEGLRGGGFTSALTIMNGVPNSPINRYHQVVGARIERNTIVDSRPVHLNAGADAERSAPPLDSRFAGNLIVTEDGEDVFRIDGDISGIAFEGNVQSRVDRPRVPGGFERRPVRLARAANGLLYPADRTLRNIGAPRTLAPIAKAETGVAWRAKDLPEPQLDAGQSRTLTPGDDLARAVNAAGPGDVLILPAGRYPVDETLVIDKPLSIMGPPPAAGQAAWETPVEITFNRPTLFQIEDGGSLRLSRVNISGRDAPDAAGNAVIRTSPSTLIRAYDLVIEQSRIGDLAVNAAFHVLAPAKGSLARRVTIDRSLFEGISGSVVKADPETDDLGLYSVEDLVVTNSTFREVGGEAVSLYRGGTDESTFGPRALLKDSVLERVGRGPRNASGASVRLHGVPYATLSGLRVADSAPVRIVHTVGEPRTLVTDNRFVGTPTPEVRELIAKVPPRAQLTGNIVEPGRP